MIYGYGIVDKDNKPWWDESCVCADRGPLDSLIVDLNDDHGDPRCPYRVVTLRMSVRSDLLPAPQHGAEHD
jgi:hypothetical protein